MPEVKAKLKNGNLKTIMPTLQDILAKYWFYLNLTYKIENL